MLLTERQVNTLKMFAGGKLISAQALCKDMAIAKGIAQNRIAELNDKGLIRKMNQTQYQISKKGEEALTSHVPLTARPEVKQAADEDDDKPLSDKEMDRLLDGAVEELVSGADDEEVIEVPEPEPQPAPAAAPMTLEQFAELPAGDERDEHYRQVSELLSKPANPVAYPEAEQLPATHPAMLAIERLQKQLNSPRPVPIKDLDLKREVLINLAKLLEQSISDVLVNIADDLDRAAGNEI